MSKTIWIGTEVRQDEWLDLMVEETVKCFEAKTDAIFWQKQKPMERSIRDVQLELADPAL